MSTLMDVLDEIGINSSPLAVLYHEEDNTVYRLPVPRLDAFATWRKLHDVAQRTGYLPVIMGGALQLEFFNDTMELYASTGETQHYTVNTILGNAAKLDMGAWLARLLKGADFDHSEWSDEVEVKAQEGWRIPRYYDKDELNIALASTVLSWQLPAYLKFGGFNACPFPEEHVALFKRWDERVGLEIIHLSHDTVDARILRPPIDRDLAIQLTLEQFVYCGETACYNNTVEKHAACLMKGERWHFWWD